MKLDTSVKGESEEGIALVEVLVSLLVLALIASSVTVLLFQLSSVRARTLDAPNRDEIARFRSIIRMSVSAGLREGDAFRVAGGSREIKVRARLKLGPFPLDRYDVALQEQAQRGLYGTTYMLVVSSDEAEEEIVFERELPDKLSINRITYFGGELPQDDTDTQWYDEWTFAHAPKLVRLDFTETSGETALIIGP